jgi:hypothetical protein
VQQPDHAKVRASGPGRRAAALQLPVHQQWVEMALSKRPDDIDIRELEEIISELCDKDEIKVTEEDVQLVLALAGYGVHDTTVAKLDVMEPLAMWRGLNGQVHFIETHFKEYDADCSHTLHRVELERLLTDINGGTAPDEEEVSWVLSFATTTGNADGGIGMTELRAAVAVWFHHVSPIRVKAKRGCYSCIPYIYAGVAAIACCFVIAATTVLFSEEKTKEWFGAVAMSIVWKLIIIDAIKATFCGRVVEFMFGLLLGECLVETAMLSVLQDGIEGAAEDGTSIGGSEVILPEHIAEGVATAAVISGGTHDRGGVNARP